MNQPVDAVAARTDRVAQGVVGVGLLAAFVFRVPLLVPAIAAVLAISAVAGPRANGIHLIFERWIAPRLPASRDTAPEATIPAQTVQAQDVLATVVLAVAALGFLIGIALVAWILVIGEAVIAIVAATTRIHVAERFGRSLWP